MADAQDVPSVVEKPKPVFGSANQVAVMAVSAIQMVFLAVILADGRSVMVLREAPPFVLVDQLQQSFTFRDLTGWPYGIGADHDQFGKLWDRHGSDDQNAGDNLQDLYQRIQRSDAYTAATTTGAKNTVMITGIRAAVANNPDISHSLPSWLKCDRLTNVGQALKAFCYFGCFLAFAALMTATLTMAWQKPWQSYAFIVQILLWASSFIIMCLLSALYDGKFECNNPIIKDITMKLHFELSYALGMSCFCVVASTFISPYLIHTAEYVEVGMDGEELRAAAEEQGEDVGERHTSYLAEEEVTKEEDKQM